MKLNFNFQFKGLDKNELKGESAGKVLAAYLSSSNKGNSIKLWDWALKLYNGEEIDLDPTDLDVLVGLIETAENLTVLAKGQILLYINETKSQNK